MLEGPNKQTNAREPGRTKQLSWASHGPDYAFNLEPVFAHTVSPRRFHHLFRSASHAIIDLLRCSGGPSETLKSYFLFYFLSLQLSQFFPLCPPLPIPPPAPTVNPHTIVHVHGTFVHVLCLVPSCSFYHYSPAPPIFDFREGKEGRKRVRETLMRERNIDRLPSACTLTRDQTCVHPRHGPDWELGSNLLI